MLIAGCNYTNVIQKSLLAFRANFKLSSYGYKPYVLRADRKWICLSIKIIKCTFLLDLHIHMNRELRGHSERSFRCVWFYVTLLELLVCNARPCTLFRHLARLILSFLLTAAGTSGALCAWGGWHLDGLGPGLS